MLQDRMANSSIGVHLEVADGADPPQPDPPPGALGPQLPPAGPMR